MKQLASSTQTNSDCLQFTNSSNFNFKPKVHFLRRVQWVSLFILGIIFYSSTNLQAQCDIQLSGIVSNSSPNELQNITYTFTAKNNGPNAASGVVVTALVPTGMTFMSATPQAGTYMQQQVYGLSALWQMVVQEPNAPCRWLPVPMLEPMEPASSSLQPTPLLPLVTTMQVTIWQRFPFRLPIPIFS